MSKKQHTSQKSKQAQKNLSVPVTEQKEQDLQAVAAEKETAPEIKTKETGAVTQGKTPKEKASVGMQILKFATAAVVVLVLFWFGFTTVVKEGNCAVILRFGAVREEITDAGLYFKLPWPFESVVSYDNRLQSLEGNSLETITKDKKNIVLQSNVAWKISDPVLYHNSVGVNNSANTFINDQVFSATNSTLGSYALTGLVSLNASEIKIDEIQEKIFTRVHDVCLANYGIEVVDVSILRISLPGTNLDTVFEQMRTDRETEIDTILAKAEAEANKIITDADTSASKIESDAETEAGRIKGEADAAVAQIHNAAQAADIGGLYQFLMGLDAAVAAIGPNTSLMIKTDKYPFNILFDYAEIANEDTVLYDLSYILTQLPEQKRNDLIDAIIEMLNEMQTPTTP
ncbi:MAG: protease modulator HflC [Ruminococcaceae bacterium]|nr:protease modulator HflC [Oscillospiraceae bacterium]